jgi:hypothetical protein
MEYKGTHYQVVQAADPAGWNWTVILNDKATKMGDAFNRVNGIARAQRIIDKAFKDRN